MNRMTDNHQATVVFAELARNAVDRYLDQLDARLKSLADQDQSHEDATLKSPAAQRPSRISCIDSIRKLLTADLRPAFTYDLAERLQYGAGVRAASKDALERFLALLDSQLRSIEHAEREVGASSDEPATTPSCFEQCKQSARKLSQSFPENFQAIAAVEARRLAGVPLLPQPPAPEGRLFAGAPHDSLWPTERRARIVDEHSVSAPTYRWGSRGGR